MSSKETVADILVHRTQVHFGKSCAHCLLKARGQYEAMGLKGLCCDGDGGGDDGGEGG